MSDLEDELAKLRALLGDDMAEASMQFVDGAAFERQRTIRLLKATLEHLPGGDAVIVDLVCRTVFLDDWA